MNYRHSYHAGNFADCFKHALLIGLLDMLARKSAPYFVLDTHAGSGWYNLEGEAARRTAEAERGIGRLLKHYSEALERYVTLVRQLGLYPGSPMLSRAVMRGDDRLVCCELYPEDAFDLRRRFARDPQVEVHVRSGWEALGALLPPREKRGLIFIDPPFEARDEFTTLAESMRRGYVRFRSGIFAAWYPIKRLAAVRTFHAQLSSSGMRDIIAVELHLRDTSSVDELNGCGLAVVNPPHQFEQQAHLIAEAVLREVGDGENGAATQIIRLVNE